MMGVKGARQYFSEGSSAVCREQGSTKYTFVATRCTCACAEEKGRREWIVWTRGEDRNAYARGEARGSREEVGREKQVR